MEKTIPRGSCDGNSDGGAATSSADGQKPNGPEVLCNTVKRQNTARVGEAGMVKRRQEHLMSSFGLRPAMTRRAVDVNPR
jgi:hypothetical protein